MSQVRFDRGLAVDGAFGFGDLLIDPTQRAPGAVMPIQVMNYPVRDASSFLATGRRPRLGPHQPIRDGLVGVFIVPFADHIGQMWDAGAQDERHGRSVS